MVSQEVVQKLHFIVQKFGEVMPKTDLMAFKQSIESYIRSGAYMSTGNQRVDNLVQAIIQSMNKEKAPPAPQVGGGRVGQWGYGGYRNYWYYPWWWNYWYYYWTPTTGGHTEAMAMWEAQVSAMEMEMALSMFWTRPSISTR